MVVRKLDTEFNFTVDVCATPNYARNHKMEIRASMAGGAGKYRPLTWGIYALDGMMNTSEHCSSGLERWLSDAVANLLACPPTVIVRRAAGTGVVDFTGSHLFYQFLFY
jgi:hypothetical protein